MDRIDIKYFTDPLCCWSWGFEPQWRKLIFHYRDHLKWHYVLGGLIPTWNGFVDNVNSVSRPAQMGPLWMHAQQISGMPMGHRIWIENAPSSSFPSCVAVKSARLQSNEFEERLLRKLREYCHLKGKNICDTTVIREAAMELGNEHNAFEFQKFMEDFQSKSGQDTFRKDWHETRLSGVNRFPTLILNKDTQTIQVSGYRSFDVVRKALYFLNPSLQAVQFTSDIEEYRKFWGGLLPREEMEFYKDTEVNA